MAGPSLRSALWAVGLAWSGTLIAALVLGAALAPISVDQPLTAQDLQGWTLRWGGVMAVAMASGAALGLSLPPATPRATASVVALTVVGVIGLALLAAVGAILAVRHDLWGHDWGLPSRSGHAARLAALAAAEWLGLPSAAAGGWLLFRRRTGHSRGSGHG